MTPSTTWCAVQLARSYGPRASCNGALFNFHASREDCRACPLRPRCVSPSRHARVVVFNIIHPSLLRARRKRLSGGNHEHHFYRRHRWRVERVHGEAKTWHGLARAINQLGLNSSGWDLLLERART
ncbi:transposase [Bradyrhizobium sp. WSM 1738]|nr:transposase [Bradyrhizobium hereditatis]